MNALLSPSDIRSLQEYRSIFIQAWFEYAIGLIDLEEVLMDLVRSMMIPQDIFRRNGFPSQAAMLAGLDDRDDY